ncbi:MAG: hypothetical protein JRH15_09845 [Deltaproteobacteria bacterium]|nr:hypothetical protein [Deltaproteobacteria bacterium]
MNIFYGMADKIRTMERAYEVMEGLTSQHDTLPKVYFDKAIDSGPLKGAVLDSSKFETMKKEYYALRGWDPDTGVPTRETLTKFGLEDVARDMKACKVMPIVD